MKTNRFFLAVCLALLPALALAEGISAPLFQTGTADTKKTEGSYYSQVRIETRDLGSGQSLEGFHVFLNGKLVGTSPLSLKGFLVNRPKLTLSVEKPDFFEATRKNIHIPPDGIVDIAVLSLNPTRSYTRPSIIGGLALMGGSMIAYAQPEGERIGLGMLLGGLVVVGVTQIVSRWIHLPALKKRLHRQNHRHLEKTP
jgi:hypothetical protein